MGRLDGFSTIVTGGTSGMGRATTELWLQEGARVFVGDVNDDRGEEMLAALREQGFADRVRFLRVDVANEADIAALVAAAVAETGKLDVMFNNAGIDGAFGQITDLDVAHWDQTFAVNTRGVFLGVKHAARVMKTQAWGGSIINTASMAALTSGAGGIAYTASKAAVTSLTQAAALELGRHRIRVNAICPGIIYTPMMHRGRPEQADRVSLPLQPLPFRGEARHVAQAALFLASSESEFVSGEFLRVDGGLYAVGPLAHLPVAQPSATRAGMSYGTTGRKTDARDPTRDGQS